MRGAVRPVAEPQVLGVGAAGVAGGEGQVGRADVGAVEEDQAVVVQELHVHPRHADVPKELPAPGGARRRDAAIGEE